VPDQQDNMHRYRAGHDRRPPSQHRAAAPDLPPSARGTPSIRPASPAHIRQTGKT
jgi:hypothetical protein